MFKTIFDISKSTANKLFPVLARNSKTMEELGEFSEALLHKLGYLPHKTMKEPLEGEAADVIICVLDALAGAYPELSATQLTIMLEEQLEKKSKKWEALINLRGNS